MEGRTRRQTSKGSTRPSLTPSMERRNTFETLVTAGRNASDRITRAVRRYRSSGDLRSQIRHLGPCSPDAGTALPPSYPHRPTASTPGAASSPFTWRFGTPAAPGRLFPASPPPVGRLPPHPPPAFWRSHSYVRTPALTRRNTSDSETLPVSQIPSPALTPRSSPPRHPRFKQRLAQFLGQGTAASARKPFTPTYTKRTSNESDEGFAVPSLPSPVTPAFEFGPHTTRLRNRLPRAPRTPVVYSASSAPPHLTTPPPDEFVDLVLPPTKSSLSRRPAIRVKRSGTSELHRRITELKDAIELASDRTHEPTLTTPRAMKRATLQPSAAAGSRFRQIEAAKDEQKHLDGVVAKYGVARPPYELLELIGKGAFGRVYKGRALESQRLVAVKIISVDHEDYKETPDAKDDSIDSLIKEISVQQQLTDSQAQNVNPLLAAFSVHSQLWIVSEYCPGGSVHTLMKAFKNGLDEHHIIPIAREVAIALKYIHSAGVIHRDIKCANILITQDGRVQLCDFGIAGVVEGDTGKRTTIIGTPNWMPPEMHMSSQFTPLTYGAEVDCWAFGSTVYEMATGLPPNARFHPSMLHKVLTTAPRLADDRHSADLRDFVAFCLRERPQDRPSAAAILEHPFVRDTARRYPAAGLVQLLDHYALWEQAGNYRLSLFTQHGAAGPDSPPDVDREDDEWNFSTTDDYDQKIRNRMSALIEQEDDRPPDAVATEDRVHRGQQAMMGLFDPTAAPYRYGGDRALSDLPFRNLGPARDADRMTMIDLDMAAPVFDDQSRVDLADPATIRASRFGSLYRDPYDDDDDFYDQSRQHTRRATRDWRFPGAADDDTRRTTDWTFPMPEEAEKRRTTDWTFPADEDRANRKTTDWTFPPMDTAYDTKRWTGARRAPAADDHPHRRTQDWTFPSMSEGPASSLSDLAARSDSFSSPSHQPSHAARPSFDEDDYPVATQSAPESPNRGSMIDLDAAMVPPPRPSTSGSEAPSFTTDKTSGNPFDLEPEAPVAHRRSHRTSLHTKSQSEPPHGYHPPTLPSDLSHTALAQQDERRSPGSASSLGGTTQLSATQQQMDRLHALGDQAMAWVAHPRDHATDGRAPNGAGHPHPFPSTDPHHLARMQALNHTLPAILERDHDPHTVPPTLDHWLDTVADGRPSPPADGPGPSPRLGRPVYRDANGHLAMAFPPPRPVRPEALEHGATDAELHAAIMAAASDMMTHFSLAGAAFESTADREDRP